MAYGRIIQATIGPPGGQGQTVQDLRMTFTVKKSITLDHAMPTAELKIYNMSLQSYFNFVKINYGLLIAVGYEDESVGGVINAGLTGERTSGVPLQLFDGTIRFCRRYREKADWIVYIEADGGMWNIGGAHYSVSYQPGISVYSILANLGSSMKVPIRNLITVPTGVVFNQGFSFFGTVRDLVKLLCGVIDFNFDISGGEILLFPPTISTQKGVFLSKDTGLLQAPEPEQISTGVPDQTAIEEGGSQSLPEMRWKIQSLLLPQVGPGDVMQVQSQNFRKNYSTVISGGPAGGSNTQYQQTEDQVFMMVEEIEYTGDNWDGDFKMEARCIPVDSFGDQTQVGVA